MLRRLSRAAAWAAATSFASSLASPAFAQGLSVPMVGSALSSAATADGAAVFHNPGALGFVEEPLLHGDLTLIGGEVGYTRNRRATYQKEDSLVFARPLPADAIDPSKTGPAPSVSATPFAAAPSGFGVLPIGKTGLVAAFGSYSPYAALAKYDPNGAQRFQLREALLANVFLTPSIALRAHKRFSVGLGISYVIGYASLSRMQDFAALPELGRALAGPPIQQPNEFGPEAPPAVRELNVMARPFVLHDAFAHGATFNVGVAAEPIDNLRVGLSYQHSTDLTYAGSFELDMNDPFFTQDLASQGLQYKPMIRGDASLGFTLPKVIHAAVRWAASPSFTLQVQGQYTFWSAVSAFDVRVSSPDLAQPAFGIGPTSRILLPRAWRNTISLEAAASFAASETARPFVLVGYHSPAAPDETVDASSPDGHRIVLGGGVDFALLRRVHLLADLKALVMLPREVVTSEYDLANGRYSFLLLQGGVHVLWSFGGSRGEVAAR